MIIAIDGPAASGKGTIARHIADVYGLHHLDTGLIYRAVAKAVLDAGHSPDNVERGDGRSIALDPAKFDEQCAEGADHYRGRFGGRGDPQVRQALMNYQRAVRHQTARSGARRPRYRHGHRPRRRREIVRRAPARKCGPPGASVNFRRAAKRPTRRRSWPICCAATSAIPGGPRRRSKRRRMRTCSIPRIWV